LKDETRIDPDSWRNLNVFRSRCVLLDITSWDIYAEPLYRTPETTAAAKRNFVAAIKWIFPEVGLGVSSGCGGGLYLYSTGLDGSWAFCKRRLADLARITSDGKRYTCLTRALQVMEEFR
jgi:hypothetical protein